MGVMGNVVNFSFEWLGNKKFRPLYVQLFVVFFATMIGRIIQSALVWRLPSEWLSFKEMDSAVQEVSLVQPIAVVGPALLLAVLAIAIKWLIENYFVPKAMLGALENKGRSTMEWGLRAYAGYIKMQIIYWIYLITGAKNKVTFALFIFTVLAA
ncbi:MAG: hypothetical protein WC759_05940, partial [Candidatus Micrarchaeia archaeon]